MRALDIRMTDSITIARALKLSLDVLYTRQFTPAEQGVR
jgi:hypothetical protein